MILIGIDPGLQKTGWGIIETDGAALRHVGHGTIRPPLAGEMSERLAALSEGLEKIFGVYEPQAAAIEETYVNRNPSSSLKLGMARGAILVTLARKGLEIGEYAPALIKKSIVGRGQADKAQIGMMMKVLLPACGELSEDEADALAVAVTHAHYLQSAAHMPSSMS